MVHNYVHRDLQNVTTPINVVNLQCMLHISNYDVEESKFLVEGFSNGFSLQYTGPRHHKNVSPNLPFKVGDKFDMWEKIMGEVQMGRYTGPFEDIPYHYFVQSPCGLVLKSGNKTRLIFHLSYNFEDYKSINHYLPMELCTVHYPDLDHAWLKTA